MALDTGSIQQSARYSMSAANALKVRSALNPLLWMIGIYTPFALAGSYFLGDKGWVAILLLGLLALMVLTGIGVFIYFALRSPQRLQSEDYQLRHETIQMVKTSGELLPLDHDTLRQVSDLVLSLPPARDVADQ